MMKRVLPPTVKFYRRTPEFDERTIPDGLRKSHQTKLGVWGRIVVLEGQLRYRILEPRIEDLLLDPNNPGIIAPTSKHEVQPVDGVRFFVEFYR